MQLPRNVEALAVALMFASCVLPEQGGSPTIGSRYDIQSLGGTACTGGTGTAGLTDAGSTSGGTSGGTDCATGGTTTTNSTCTYTIPDSGSCPETYCAGLCNVSTASPPNGFVDLLKGSLFGYRIGLVPPGATVIALGAVTTVPPGANRGHIQLGLYDENAQGKPGALLAYTAQLTATDSTSPPVEGKTNVSYQVPVGNSSGAYWILMAIDLYSEVYVDEWDTPQPENAIFNDSISCLPLATASCPMPAPEQLYAYPAPHAPKYFVAYLYARYAYFD